MESRLLRQNWGPKTGTQVIYSANSFTISRAYDWNDLCGRMNYRVESEAALLRLTVSDSYHGLQHKRRGDAEGPRSIDMELPKKGSWIDIVATPDLKCFGPIVESIDNVAQVKTRGMSFALVRGRDYFAARLVGQGGKVRLADFGDGFRLIDTFWSRIRRGRISVVESSTIALART